MEKIVLQFEVELQSAFDKYANDLWSIGRTPEGLPCFPDDDEVILRHIRIYSGKCGAASGAAVKRAKRALVNQALIEEKDTYDFTITNVKHLTKRTIGRSFDNNVLCEFFGKPGRSARNKSQLEPEQLQQLEEQIKKEVSKLIALLSDRKNAAKTKWKQSNRRAEIMRDWSDQRKGMAFNL